ncbi:MAG: DUF3179 domain-containing protein [Magnetococcales bacterium]|nr:DUF3179 domain-containing protein [Magnetococcales bacterium]
MFARNYFILFILSFFMITLFIAQKKSVAYGKETRFSQSWPTTNFSKLTISLDEIISGGPPKDGIPAIDNPDFISQKSASKWLDPREPVISIDFNGQARAYPLQILMFHEIVNDKIGKTSITITFCPLCNAAIVFKSEINGNSTTFGTTGFLRNSDLVMYDRLTMSWWQQFSGKGIVGKHAGHKLERIPSTILSYKKFKKLYPKGMVLSKKTGFNRNYGHNPYRGYDRIGNNSFLLQDPVDTRLPAMERVLGVIVNGKSRVYPFSILSSLKLINDTVAGEPVVIFSNPGVLSTLDAAVITNSNTTLAATAYLRKISNRTLTFYYVGDEIFDRETKSKWNFMGRSIAGPLNGKQLQQLEETGVHFSFAWLAFRPKSTVFSNTK